MKNLFSRILGAITDKNGDFSIRRVLALAFSIHFIYNLNRCIDLVDKIVTYLTSNGVIEANAIASVLSSLAQLSMLIGLEASLIAALLALTTWQNNIQIKEGDKTTGD